MKTTRLQILALAVAGIVTLPGAASAQFRVGDDGRALDSSNRVGSNGRNDGGGAIINSPYQVTGNQIVTGNVTGGREFRGNINYTDPNEFRGRTAGDISDRFIRRSAGVADAQNPNFNLNTARPFYGESRTMQAPAGFVQNRWTGAYVPPPTNASAADLNENYRATNSLSIPAVENPQTGELILPGPTDSTNQQTLLTASPLYGVRQWRMGEESDRAFIENYTTLGREDVAGRMRLSNEEIDRMRAELGAGGELQQRQQQAPADPNAPQQQQGGENVNPMSLTTPFGTPADPAVNNPRVQSEAATGGLSTGQGAQSRLLVPPEMQSAQYAELQRRLQRQRELRQRPLPPDVQANQDLQEKLRLRDEIAREAARQEAARAPQDEPNPQAQPQRPITGPGAVGVPDFEQKNRDELARPTPDAKDNAPQDLSPQAQAQREQDAQRADGAKPDPVKIRSLATGVEAKGLSELLTEAEEQMKQGKFTTALDQYAAAEQVAPNNPLVVLGRANAELGASYYARAEAHLREAFMTDPALLMGQYDLREFFGTERLQFLVKDLKEIANTQKAQARPVFLLAYIAYNTGNDRQAAGYLELAEQRAGPTDPLFPLLREHWKLPIAPAAGENK